MPLPLLALAGAVVGAALGWWPLHVWAARSVKTSTVGRAARIASAAATAASFALLVWRLADGSDAPALPAALAFAAVAVVLGVVDVLEKRLPNTTIATMLGALAVALVLAAALTGEWSRLLGALVGAAVMFALYLILALISPRSMGMGDVKLAAPLGLLLGWFGLEPWLFGLLSAFVCGGVVAVVMIAARRTTLRGSLPFGPSMLVGALIGVLIAG
ncbi:A24 family peptidase [Microbacterium capsulatum]|uniref:A24 family peptidase n=1 Tax=Microbacterium capsulatum TaxID=3041921 RepID=A0ABU0XEB1_9MICO|nr:A24 family peptidase [Microbacterium sp. ASV81]MDQ4213396.1 A24 family peptidase [Microbacterium sp. ASV81]